MGLLVILATILWPVISGWGDADKIDRAADDVRALLQGARLHAIENGAPVRFAFEPESPMYRVEVAGGQQPFQQAPADETARRDFDSAAFLGEHELEEGLRFVAPMDSTSADDRSDDQQQVGTAIIFQPDGTANDVEFMIVDSKEIGRRITVRGLTGSVSAGPPQSTGRPASNGTNAGPQQTIGTGNRR